MEVYGQDRQYDIATTGIAAPDGGVPANIRWLSDGQSVDRATLSLPRFSLSVRSSMIPIRRRQSELRN